MTSCVRYSVRPSAYGLETHNTTAWRYCGEDVFERVSRVFGFALSSIATNSSGVVYRIGLRPTGTDDIDRVRFRVADRLYEEL